MSNKISVSVIMACYNSERYLREAIASILGQSITDLELILIDDCSVDSTLSICEFYKQQDDRVVVIPLTENSGAAHARNAGITMAKGEWIAVLDSDDIATPDRLEQQLKFAQTNRNLILIGSNSEVIDREGNLIKAYRYPTNHAELLKNLYSLKSFPPHSSILYRTDSLRKNSGYNVLFERSEDWDLWLRLAATGCIGSVDKILVKIRKHESNISITDGGMLQEKYGMIATICNVLRQKGYADPSNNNDVSRWENFKSEIDNFMISYGFYDRKRWWIKNTAIFHDNPNKVIGIAHFGIELLKSGYAVKMLKDRWFSGGLAKKIATKIILAKCVV